MRLSELEPRHLDGCVSLFMDGLARQAARTPALEIRHIGPDVVREMLADRCSRSGGLVLTDNARLVGYLAGEVIEGFFGAHRGGYVPEWAFAAAPGVAFDACSQMYQAAGQRWADLGCAVHVVNLLHADDSVREAYSWNGFGFLCIDAVRRVEPIGAVIPTGIRILPARPGDVPALLPLAAGLNRHLAGAPSFKFYDGIETPEEVASWVEGPGHHAWIAWKGDRAVGFIKCAPVEHGAAWVVRGDRSFAVNGAYVDPGERAAGVAKALLSTVMAWAADAGMLRCSVDFEAGNPEAARFWLKYFQPVCVSMLRRLDHRLSDRRPSGA